MAGAHDLLLEQGATFSRSITWKDEDGAPINITGYSARLQVRKDASSPTTVLEMTTTNGRISITGPSGILNLTVAASDTEDLPPGSYLYDLELESPGGVVTRLLEGSLSISPEVSR